MAEQDVGDNNPRENATGQRSLRELAEEKFRQEDARAAESVSDMLTETARHRVFELSVQHIELELQNDQLRKTQAALKDAVEFSNSVIVGMHEGFTVSDAEGVYVEVNPAFCQMTGFSRDELLGKGIPPPFWPPESVGLLPEILSDINNGNSHFETVLMRKNGERFPVMVSLWMVKSPTGARLRYVATVTDITERRKAEKTLALRENYQRALLDNFQFMVWLKDKESRFLAVNQAFATGFGWPSAEALVGKNDFDIAPLDLAHLYREDDQTVLANGISKNVEELIEVDGQRRWFETYKSPVNVDGDVIGTVGFSRDITERKQQDADRLKLEAQLQQAQKMESVGRLAGGVAHDFNNMLAVILGHAEMMLEQMDPAQPIYCDMLEIQKAAKRSADLTRQLLAFARQQTVMPKVLDLNETIAGIMMLLQRLIRENISLVWQPEAGLWPIEMDPSQLDQILTNLCVNARDAIIGIGTIRLAAGNRVIDADDCVAHVGMVPGEYVCLSVSDSGGGMDKAALAQIFEPFFTTKAVGQGTGLGLATVYGAVKQNGGYIAVSSEEGQGTCFDIFLPRYRGVDKAQTAVETPAVVSRGTETILLVEDEPAILQFTTRVLTAKGYTVLGVTAPAEAIRLAQAHEGIIHLLLSDVVMPEMNGHDLAEALLIMCPRIQCLFMSGYTADVIADNGVLDDGIHFIQKPFSIADLTATVRSVLDA
jgi:two-component system cell cycle sensor histidine kinase/response regulator CckA